MMMMHTRTKNTHTHMQYQHTNINPWHPHGATTSSSTRPRPRKPTRPPDHSLAGATQIGVLFWAKAMGLSMAFGPPSCGACCAAGAASVRPPQRRAPGEPPPSLSLRCSPTVVVKSAVASAACGVERTSCSKWDWRGGGWTDERTRRGKRRLLSWPLRAPQWIAHRGQRAPSYAGRCGQRG